MPSAEEDQVPGTDARMEWIQPLRMVPRHNQKETSMSLGKQYLDLAVSLRRAIHKRPEPGWCEFETTYKIVSTLEGLGFDVKFGIDAVAPEAVMG